MEFFKMFGWVMLGFVPTLGVLEMASRRLGTTMLSRMVMGGMSKDGSCQCLCVKAYF